MSSALANGEPIGVSYPAIIVGLTEIALAYKQPVEKTTFQTYHRALADRMTESEWREVVQRARDFKPEKIEWAPRWWTPGMLLALLDIVRAEAALLAGTKPPDAELLALEALADAEAARRT